MSLCYEISNLVNRSSCVPADRAPDLNDDHVAIGGQHELVRMILVVFDAVPDRALSDPTFTHNFERTENIRPRLAHAPLPYAIPGPVSSASSRMASPAKRVTSP